MLLARAVQLFMPGKPQVWYLDLFAGKNDYAAMERAGKDGHKEINRTNLTAADVEKKLGLDVAQKQLALIKARNTFGVFSPDAVISADADGSRLELTWTADNETAIFDADFADGSFRITIRDNDTNAEKFSFLQK